MSHLVMYIGLLQKKYATARHRKIIKVMRKTLDEKIHEKESNKIEQGNPLSLSLFDCNVKCRLLSVRY